MTYRRDPRTAVGDTDYASAVGNPGDITSLTAGATNAFIQINGGVPVWRTTVQATASLSSVTQTLKGLLEFTLFNRLSTELINYVTNPNFQADTASSAAASWTATNATQICSSSGLIINNRSMRVSPSATLTGTVDGDLNALDNWVNIGGIDKTLSLTFLSYGDTAYVDNDIEFVVWNSTDSVEVAGTTSTIPKAAKYHKVAWVAVTGKVYKLRFKTTVVAATHRIYVDSFVCAFEQERAANTLLLGPVSGSATVPTYRTVVAEDVATGTPTAGYIPVSAGAGVKPAWGSAATLRPTMVAVTTAGSVDLSLQTYAIYMCSNAADIALTLTAVTGGARDGNIYTFKNIGTKLVSINPDASETIDGSATTVVVGPMESITLAVYAAAFYNI